MTSMRMRPLNAVWLMMDSADTPMHVGVLATFQKPRNAPEDYLSRWADQMREFQQPAAPWGYRLDRGRGPSLVPRLEEEQEFDLEYHFRHTALPEPGGERELGVVVSRLHSKPLDQSMPLWEFHLIEGLERDRFAFYVKMHHALIGSVNGIDTVLSHLSTSSRSRNMPPLWAQPLASSDWGDEDTGGDSPLDPVEAVASAGKAAAGLVRNALRNRGGGRLPWLSGIPRSTLNRRINSQRRFATQQLEEARIQRVADATDSTLNDILAYLCGSSLRRFFKEYNALPDRPLIGVLPVSLRESDERLPANAIAGLNIALGTHIADPMARLAAVKESMQGVREDRDSLPREAVTPYVLMRAAPIYASQMPAVGGLVPLPFNLVVSNTPGPEEPVYFNGARLESIYPLSQLMQYSALSVNCVSYAGTLNIGFTGARDTLPHLQRLAVYLGQALVDLEEIVGIAEDAR
jgi:diacylglycerol O-acyltransferase